MNDYISRIVEMLDGADDEKLKIIFYYIKAILRY